MHKYYSALKITNLTFKVMAPVFKDIQLFYICLNILNIIAMV